MYSNVNIHTSKSQEVIMPDLIQPAEEALFPEPVAVAVGVVLDVVREKFKFIDSVEHSSTLSAN